MNRSIPSLLRLSIRRKRFPQHFTLITSRPLSQSNPILSIRPLSPTIQANLKCVSRSIIPDPAFHQQQSRSIKTNICLNPHPIPLLNTPQIRQIFSQQNYIKKCVQVECALAKSEANLGLIPSEAAEEINSILSKLDVNELDWERLEKETENVGYPILGLVRQLCEVCDGESEGKGKGKGASRWIHWGATTQDIMDTASTLQIREGLEIVEQKLLGLERTLEGMCEMYRDTAMAGRTHLQHALPVTFGYKCAVWLSGVKRMTERLEQLRPRVLLVQFGGAAGTLASLEGEGIKVRREMARELELGDPDVTWHVARDSIAEVTNVLALIGGLLGKIALDLIFMSSNEVGEVSEPFVEHRGASSTMPQKRNPISSEVMLAASKILRSNAGLVLDGMVADFERASGPWHLEWVAVPESFIVAVGALTQADFVLSGLVVNADVMMRNLKSTNGLIVAEAVMLSLASASEGLLGRNEAHDVVYAACKECIEQHKTLYDCLVSKERVTRFLPKEKLRELCDETNYLGSCSEMIDTVLGRR